MQRGNFIKKNRVIIKLLLANAIEQRRRMTVLLRIHLVVTIHATNLCVPAYDFANQTSFQSSMIINQALSASN
jgi:hypothetical protein